MAARRTIAKDGSMQCRPVRSSIEKTTVEERRCSTSSSMLRLMVVQHFTVSFMLRHAVSRTTWLIDREDEQDITYRSPNPAVTPTSAAPLMGQQQRDRQKERRNHRHTASIASLIRAEDRTDDGWGSQTLPVPAGSGKGFKFPPTPLRTDA
ncbi:hypothetical protein SCHPADRAFT_892540 [Schizopora paradoxa]|uniref:Uncharacterized protein n=1 Tax=Schizopora paradoxa TaxID=27342 RepID=A0A0H2RF62_9AGAM|nr:hypothetical protein SCHPADRAFT_892540 [Schizopora paradoxa]